LRFVDNNQKSNSTVKEKRPVFTFKSGAVYDGEWIGDRREGYGVQKWPDGARYEGFVFLKTRNME